MSNYDDTNRGQIWGNEDKNKEGANPNWPDFKGSINVEGKEYWVSGWKKKADSHPKAPALSFQIKLKDSLVVQSASQIVPVQQAESSAADEFDSIPF